MEEKYSKIGRFLKLIPSWKRHIQNTMLFKTIPSWKRYIQNTTLFKTNFFMGR